MLQYNVFVASVVLIFKINIFTRHQKFEMVLFNLFYLRKTL